MKKKQAFQIYFAVLIIFKVGIVTGASSYSSGIKQVVSSAWATSSSGKWKIINVCSLNKEWSFFLKKAFISSQVYFRRVGFNLTKIRINSIIQCQVIRDGYLAIYPCIKAPGCSCSIWIAFFFLRSFQTSHHIRDYLNFLFRCDIFNAFQITKQTYPPTAFPWNNLPN